MERLTEKDTVAGVEYNASRELLDEDDEDDESNEEERGLSKEEFAKMIDDIMAS